MRIYQDWIQKEYRKRRERARERGYRMSTDTTWSIDTTWEEVEEEDVDEALNELLRSLESSGNEVEPKFKVDDLVRIKSQENIRQSSVRDMGFAFEMKGGVNFTGGMGDYCACIALVVKAETHHRHNCYRLSVEDQELRWCFSDDMLEAWPQTDILDERDTSIISRKLSSDDEFSEELL